MPLGQLEFTRSHCWKSSLGTAAYSIVQPIDQGAPQSKYNAIYMGTQATPVATTLGTFDRVNDAINACQVHYTAL